MGLYKMGQFLSGGTMMPTEPHDIWTCLLCPARRPQQPSSGTPPVQRLCLPVPGRDLMHRGSNTVDEAGLVLSCPDPSGTRDIHVFAKKKHQTIPFGKYKVHIAFRGGFSPTKNAPAPEKHVKYSCLRFVATEAFSRAAREGGFESSNVNQCDSVHLDPWPCQLSKPAVRGPKARLRNNAKRDCGGPGSDAQCGAEHNEWAHPISAYYGTGT
ncbi:hypothetical protein DFH06DRAFT_1308058 [Mycena polygramma]|nr:hypothetical protein DFH06DRAFT_1308058 [Mycena polygramma]